MANNPKKSEPAQKTMDKAKDAVTDIGEEARGAAESVTGKAEDVTERMTKSVSDLSAKAKDTMSSVGDQMRNLAGTIRESVPQSGMLGSAASALAGTLESGGSYLQEQNLADIVEDVSVVIRRHPITSVLVGVSVGFMLARTLRSL